MWPFLEVIWNPFASVELATTGDVAGPRNPLSPISILESAVPVIYDHCGGD